MPSTHYALHNVKRETTCKMDRLIVPQGIGNVTVNVHPLPFSLSTVISPPRRRKNVRDHHSPYPMPFRLVVVPT
jgi:hypothetical protein